MSPTITSKRQYTEANVTDHTEFHRELKRHQIMRLWTENVPVEEIVRLTGSTLNSVRATLSKERRRKTNTPLRMRRVPVRVRSDWLDEAQREATRRGIEPAELISRIVGIVIGDRMVNAVLDDMGAA